MTVKWVPSITRSYVIGYEGTNSNFKIHSLTARNDPTHAKLKPMKHPGCSSFRKAFFLLCLTIVITFAECSIAPNRRRSRRQRDEELGGGRYKKVGNSTVVLKIKYIYRNPLIYFHFSPIRMITMADALFYVNVTQAFSIIGTTMFLAIAPLLIRFAYCILKDPLVPLVWKEMKNRCKLLMKHKFGNLGTKEEK